MIKLCLCDKEGAWLQVNHVLACINGNNQANQENEKNTQAKKMDLANSVIREKLGYRRKLHKNMLESKIRKLLEMQFVNRENKIQPKIREGSISKVDKINSS